MSGPELPEVDVVLADGVDSVVCAHCGAVTVHTWTGTPQWTFPLSCGHDWPSEND